MTLRMARPSQEPGEVLNHRLVHRSERGQEVFVGLDDTREAVRPLMSSRPAAVVLVVGLPD